MGLENFNKQSRPILFKKLNSEVFDLVIIGGGITGASIFRDAAIRGLKVALIEARDFSWGTSSRSSKLIHGGLRYLKRLGFHLARESCKERNLHIRLNKRLVEPIPFLLPIYKNQGEPKYMLRAGMLLYELVSGFNNYKWHKFLSKEQTISLAPRISTDGLTGGCFYYDAAVSDNRWTIEIIKDGVRFSGTAVNYSPVKELIKEDDLVTGVRIRDIQGNREYIIKAGSVVNATGVWADSIRRMDDSALKSVIRLSRGTHLVFNEADVPVNVTTAFSSPVDRRPLFLIKREGYVLYGTSDQWCDGNPSNPLPDVDDVKYLMNSLQRFMPEAGLTEDEIQFVYSGFRPLIQKGNKNIDPANIRREDCIEVSPSGLINIMGGKLTTARRMAERIVDLVIKRTGRKRSYCKCMTHTLSIGGTTDEVDEGLSYWVEQCPELKDYFTILFKRYGVDAHEICKNSEIIYRGKDPDPRVEPIKAEVQYSCRNEMVCTVEDLLERRAGFLYWNKEKRLERLKYGAIVIGPELGLDKNEFERQLEEYRNYLEQYHSITAEKYNSKKGRKL